MSLISQPNRLQLGQKPLRTGYTVRDTVPKEFSDNESVLERKRIHSRTI